MAERYSTSRATLEAVAFAALLTPTLFVSPALAVHGSAGAMPVPDRTAVEASLEPEDRARLARVTVNLANLRLTAGAGQPVVCVLGRDTLVLAGRRGKTWTEIEVPPHNLNGWMYSPLLESAASSDIGSAAADRVVIIEADSALRAAPALSASVVTRLEVGVELDVLERRGWLRVRPVAGGPEGWLQAGQAEQRDVVAAGAAAFIERSTYRGAISPSPTRPRDVHP